MKIAFLNLYQNLIDRGAETFVYELSKRLSKNHKVDIISGKKVPPARWYFLWRFFLDPQGLSILWFTLKNLGKIWKEKYDVVIPINGGWQPAIVRLVTWLYGAKMVISGQSGMGWDDKNNLWCFPNCFIALSSHAKKWAKKANPFVNVKYIPNGVDIDKFCPGGKTIETRLNKPIILCAAALTKTKRIDLAIKAVAKLEGVSLLVCGDGDLRDKIKDLGYRMLGERFQLIKVPYEDMPKVYRTADVFTLPSESYYSFENAIVEAMASGLPVVANNDPIRNEIVGNAGILVDPTDTEAYTEALKTALTKNWGDKPRKQAEKFSWDIICDKYRKLFDEL
ncbi:MAG: glycosyltransferase [bacterium]